MARRRPRDHVAAAVADGAASAGRTTPATATCSRMQQAVKVLYGQASPSEALQSATLQVRGARPGRIPAHVAANAHFAGVPDVRYAAGRRARAGARRRVPAGRRGHAHPAQRRPAPHARHADHHRSAANAAGTATSRVHNQGEPIEPAADGRGSSNTASPAAATPRARRRNPASAARACSSRGPTWARWAARSRRATRTAGSAWC